MRKSTFTESQIAGILQEPEAGMAEAEAARKRGINAATFYQWRFKCGGMSVSDMQRLRELEQENTRLKRMYADPSLDHAALKEAVKKNLTPVQRRISVRTSLWPTPATTVRPDLNQTVSAEPGTIQ